MTHYNIGGNGSGHSCRLGNSSGDNSCLLGNIMKTPRFIAQDATSVRRFGAKQRMKKETKGQKAVQAPLVAAEHLGSSGGNRDAGVAVRASQIRPLAPREDAEGVPPKHLADRPRAVGSARTLRAVTRGGWPPNSQGIAEFYDGGLAPANG